MSFISKLKINPEQEVVLLNVPAHLLPAFSFLKYRQSFPKTEKATQVIFFAFNKMMLEKNATTIINNLTEDGLLWIAYPKKSGAIQSDLIRDEGWQMM